MNDDPLTMLERELVGAAKRQRVPRNRRLSFGGIAATALVAITLVIAVGAIVLAGGHNRAPTVPPSAASSRQQLINSLAVLRRPQTKTDLSLPLLAQLRGERRKSTARLLLRLIDLPLVRLAAVAPWAEKLYVIALKPVTKQQPPSRRGTPSVPKIGRSSAETLALFGTTFGLAPPETAAQIAATGEYTTNGNSSSSVSFGSTDDTDGWSETFQWSGMVPDGVAKVIVQLPPQQGIPHGKTLLGIVHGNVFAVQFRISGQGTGPTLTPIGPFGPTYIWYASNRRLIKWVTPSMLARLGIP